jgi:ATP-dependent DNA ligase
MESCTALQILQSRSRDLNASLCGFDLLELNGTVLSTLSLVDRKAMLAQLLRKVRLASGSASTTRRG